MGFARAQVISEEVSCDEVDSGKWPDQGGHVYYVREFIFHLIRNMGLSKDYKEME